MLDISAFLFYKFFRLSLGARDGSDRSSMTSLTFSTTESLALGSVKIVCLIFEIKNVEVGSRN